MSANQEKAVRVGIVPYLNVQPLVWAFRGNARVDICSAPPRELAQRLHEGHYDVAIVPVFEYFQNPGYTIIPGAAIAADGVVKSVALFAECPLEEIETIYMDPASLTSVNLLKVICAERCLRVKYIDGNAPGALARAEAKLLIGDPALAEIGRHKYTFDLAGIWRELTGLPFVFAAWLVHPKAAALQLNSLFTDAKVTGLANLKKIASEVGPQFGCDGDEAFRYLRDNIDFELGPREIAGWQEFGRLCVKHGLIGFAPALNFHEA